MTARAAGRGQLLVVFGLILTGWVSARAMLWEAPGGPFAVIERASASPAADSVLADALSVDVPVQAFLRPVERMASSYAGKPLPAAPAPLPPDGPVAGRQPAFMQAFADVPLPGGFAHTMPAGMPPAFPPSDRGEAGGGSRWSADGWLLLRPDGGKAGKAGLGAAATATYGASQAGAVVRYRLAPDSAHRPAAYLRASAALNGSRQKEAAFGASVRPLGGVPVVAAVEARVTDDRFGSRVRPVVLAVTELPPFALPAGLRGEAYAQAGYAGGKGATAFVDGQLRADRQMARVGHAEVRIGAGTWGGAQEDAARLDIGPSAMVSIPVADRASARMGFDWRFRIVGQAAPASGPALTLSAGF